MEWGLTLFHDRGFRRRLHLFDTAGEVGPAIGQVVEPQTTVVTLEDEDLGAGLHGGVLLLLQVGGVQDFPSLHILTHRIW